MTFIPVLEEAKVRGLFAADDVIRYALVHVYRQAVAADIRRKFARMLAERFPELAEA